MTGDRKFPTTPTSTFEGNFVPLYRRNHTLEGGMYVIEHELYVDGTVDIQPGDKLSLTSNGTTGTYLVRRVIDMYMASFPMKYALISTEA